jgi:integration host factor subunit alpha
VVSSYDVKIIVASLLTMKTVIKRDHAMLFSGFGKFEAYAKKARKGRNPATNETMILEPRKVVTFQVSKKLRQAMNKDLRFFPTLRAKRGPFGASSSLHGQNNSK